MTNVGTIEWFTPEPRQAFEWMGQTQKTIASVEKGLTSVVATVIGPPGGSGPQGIPGPQGEGAQTDPGDFTLWFDNQLI